MTLLLAIIFICLFIFSILIDIKQNIRFQEKLNTQNLNIIFMNNNEIDIKAEFFKKIDFFKLNDKGKSFSDIRKIKFVRYSTNDDYFLKTKLK